MARYKKWVWSGKKQKILVYDVKHGMSYKDIAVKVGCGAPYISQLVQSDEYEKRKTDMMRNVVEDARDAIKCHVMKAIKKIGEIAERGSNMQKVQLDAAKAVLHYAGIEPDKVTEVIQREYKPDELAHSLGVANEIEKVTHRISCQGSKHIIKKISENAPNAQEGIPPDARESGADKAPIEATVAAGQETVPEKPILPM